MNIHYLETLTLEVPFKYWRTSYWRSTYFEEHLPTTAFALHLHHSLTLYSAPSSSLSLLLLLISPMFVFASNNLNLVSHFPWSHFHCCYFFFMSFLSFSVLFNFFLSLLIKRILLSRELIKIFLPPSTSLKYVHVSK